MGGATVGAAGGGGGATDGGGGATGLGALPLRLLLGGATGWAGLSAAAAAVGSVCVFLKINISLRSLILHVVDS